MRKKKKKDSCGSTTSMKDWVLLEKMVTMGQNILVILTVAALLVQEMVKCWFHCLLVSVYPHQSPWVEGGTLGLLTICNISDITFKVFSSLNKKHVPPPSVTWMKRYASLLLSQVSLLQSSLCMWILAFPSAFLSACFLSQWGLGWG